MSSRKAIVIAVTIIVVVVEALALFGAPFAWHSSVADFPGPGRNVSDARHGSDHALPGSHGSMSLPLARNGSLLSPSSTPGPTESVSSSGEESIDQRNLTVGSADVGSKPADAVGSKPADAVGSKPADAVGSKPADAVGSKPADAVGSKPADAVGSKPADAVGSEPADAVGSKPADAVGSKPADAVGSEPADASGSAALEPIPPEPWNPPRHYDVIESSRPYEHPNPQRWAGFEDSEDEYRYALGGGALQGQQRVLPASASRTVPMPLDLEAALELEVYGQQAHPSVRVRGNEWGYLARLDWMRMTPPQGPTVGAVEALRVFSLARDLWPRAMRSVSCATALRWTPTSMWAQRWQHLCAYEAVWLLSHEGTRQHDTMEVATAQSSARCTRRLEYTYCLVDGIQFSEDETVWSPSYCACELSNVTVDVPSNGALPTAEFYVSTEAEMRRAEYVLGCGLRRTRGVAGGGILIEKPGPRDAMDYDVYSVRVVVRAPPPPTEAAAAAPRCPYEFFHTVKYADNPYHDIMWQYLPSRVTAALYGIPWERQRVGPRSGPKSDLRTWMEAQNPIARVEPGSCFASRLVTGVHPTVAQAGRIPGIAGPSLRRAFHNATVRMWRRPAAPGSRVLFVNRGAKEGRHVLEWRAVRGCEYVELPTANLWDQVRDVKVLIMPYGSNFVNVGFLAPGATFVLLIDQDVLLRQFIRGWDTAWMGELEAQCSVLGVKLRILQYSGASQQELFRVTRDVDFGGALPLQSDERINASELNALIAELVAS